MKVKNTLLIFAAAASMALASCKEKTEETTTETNMTTETTGPADTMDRDVDTSDSTTTVNPDTIMGP